MTKGNKELTLLFDDQGRLQWVKSASGKFHKLPLKSPDGALDLSDYVIPYIGGGTPPPPPPVNTEGMCADKIEFVVHKTPVAFVGKRKNEGIGSIGGSDS